MKKVPLLLLILFLPLLSASAVSPNDDVIKTRVISVYDGDTFTVEIDGEEEKVRILGLDTPELTASENKSTCGGEKAKAFTSALILNKEVTLVRDAQNDNRDAFGRLLRTVRINGRLDIGILLLITGNAEVYEKAEFKSKPLYQKLEKVARKLGRGIWGECTQLELPEASPPPTPSTTPEGDVSCDVKGYCSRLKSCDEAKYYLNTCGQKSLDSDGDGVPCEELCK